MSDHPAKRKLNQHRKGVPNPNGGRPKGAKNKRTLWAEWEFGHAEKLRKRNLKWAVDRLRAYYVKTLCGETTLGPTYDATGETILIEAGTILSPELLITFPLDLLPFIPVREDLERKIERQTARRYATLKKLRYGQKGLLDTGDDDESL